MNKILMTLALAGMVASAQTTYKNEENRVAQGVKSGQLTSRETANLESRQRAINGQPTADRRANGGSLTGAEKAQIRGERQGLSRNIYADKHNAATAHYGNNEVGRRRENQQDRIAQGIGNGRLNANEAAHVENRESGLNQQIRNDRSVNGGKLTGTERRQVNAQQNQLSNSIYRDKHN